MLLAAVARSWMLSRCIPTVTPLRFLDVPALGAFLAGAGFVIEAQYGDWHRGPITDVSREIVTMARRI
jgi:hypothetical protein